MAKSGASAAEVYERLLSLCEPFVCPGPWARFRDRAARRGPADPAAAFAPLAAEFPADVLAESGVASAGPDGRPVWNPALALPGEVLVALRARGSGPPDDVFTARGCVSGRLPAIAAIDDLRPGGLGEELDDCVFATFSAEDAVVLRSLGLRAAPATGLDSLGGATLREFRRRFGDDVRQDDERQEEGGGRAEGGGPGDDPGLTEDGGGDEGGPAGAAPPDRSSPEEFQLVVVGWSPAALEFAEPAGLAPLRAHLAGVDRYLGPLREYVSLWTPDPDLPDALAFALAHGDEGDVRRILGASVGRSGGRSLSERSPAPPRTPPEDCVEAASRADRVRRTGGTPDARKQARRDYEELLDRDVIGPLRRQALETADPIERTLTYMLADLGDGFHREAYATADRQSDAGERDRSESPGADHRRLMQLLDGVLKCSKEIRKCRPPHRTIDVTPGRPRNLTAPRPGLPGSASRPPSSEP